MGRDERTEIRNQNQEWSKRVCAMEGGGGKIMKQQMFTPCCNPIFLPLSFHLIFLCPENCYISYYRPNLSKSSCNDKKRNIC